MNEISEVRIREIVREELTRSKRTTLLTAEDLMKSYSLAETVFMRRLFDGVNLEWEAGKCVDWHNAKGGSGNWKLAFKNWLGKAEPTKTKPEEPKRVYRAPVDEKGKPLLGGKA